MTFLPSNIPRSQSLTNPSLSAGPSSTSTATPSFTATPPATIPSASVSGPSSSGTGRRLSRKLPPAWTESLENLALTRGITNTSSSSGWSSSSHHSTPHTIIENSTTYSSESGSGKSESTRSAETGIVSEKASRPRSNSILNSYQSSRVSAGGISPLSQTVSLPPIDIESGIRDDRSLNESIENSSGSQDRNRQAPRPPSSSIPERGTMLEGYTVAPNASANASGGPSSRPYVLEVAPPLPPKDEIPYHLSINNGKGTTRSFSLGNIASHSHSQPQEYGNSKARSHLRKQSLQVTNSGATPIAIEQRISQQHKYSPSASSSSTSINTTKMRKPASSRSSETLMTPSTPFSRLPLPFSHRSRLSTDSSGSNACSSTRSSASACGTWSLFDEVQMADNISVRSMAKPKKESRSEKKERIKLEKELFDEDRAPTPKMLFEASLLEVVDEHGKRRTFGDLVRNRRTIVIFIRHWFCPLCAQYMNSILAEVSPDALEEASVDLIIIGNGSDKMLDGYRNKSFRCPFKMYTDPTLALYRALGLTRQTGDSGLDEDKGDYLVQTAMESTIQTVKRATKMPLRNPGHFTQLGGEFIFDGTLNVTYTHRMTNTRSHAPIRDICAEAGVRLEFIHYEPGPPPPPVHRQSYLGLETELRYRGGYPADSRRKPSVYGYEEDNWRLERDETLSRMKALKAARREGLKVLAEGYVHDKRSVVRTDSVKIVGQDLGEDEVVMGFEGLGIHQE
ncbi:hypothetical protein I316_01548 [Kwoniella heveanensis BCC8398]|uniref:Thioredoxin domain-containing protein n=1 Tax=Kwoniella heveanensis BCC8398 TaxID=1296120 RepID=A0A1B9H122_9TREE|nr:hypothetical protein I316_01548 [Kwoniella heveanensis BCC8398]